MSSQGRTAADRASARGFSLFHHQRRWQKELSTGISLYRTAKFSVIDIFNNILLVVFFVLGTSFDWYV